MFKLLRLLTELQKKGIYVSEIEVRDNDYYVIYFNYDQELYYCSVSEFAIFCSHSLPQDIREILRVIQSLLRKEKLERI